MTLKFDAQQFAALEKVAEKVYSAGVCPPDVKSEDAAFAVMLAGAEMGLGPMQAIRCIQIVKGKLSFTADFTVALARRAPDCEYFKPVSEQCTDEKAVYVTKRRGDPSPTTFTYTFAQAKRAGLVNSNTWKGHTEAMLRARCSAALARAMYPEHVAGMYTPDEAEEIARNEAGEPAPRDEQPEPTPAVDPIAAYRARVGAAASVDELVAVVLALAPTVAQAQRTDAWTAAQHRAADLGEEDLAAAIDRAKAITREPATWTLMALALAEIAAAGTPAELAAVVKRHATAAGALPPTLKAALNGARAARLRDLAPPASAARSFEQELRAAQDIPTLDAIAERMVAAALEQPSPLTVEEGRRLQALYDTRVGELEHEPAEQAA